MKRRSIDPRERIDKIQITLSETKMELRAYSTIFQCLGTASLEAKDIVGLKVIFKRIIDTIDDTNQHLNKIYRELPPD